MQIRQVINRRKFLALAAATPMAMSSCQLPSGEIRLACTAGMRRVVEPFLDEWLQRTGSRVLTAYDASGRLVAQRNAGQQFDLFLAADASYLDGLDEFAASEMICTQSARLVTRPEVMPRPDWDAVISGGLRFSLALSEAAAISAIVERHVGKSIWMRLEDVATARRTSVTEVANDVATLKVADVGLIWDKTWVGDDRLVAIDAPVLDGANGLVSLACNPARPQSKDFYDYLVPKLRSRLADTGAGTKKAS